MYNVHWNGFNSRLEGKILNFADKTFIENCKDILDNGTWDKEYDVRPRWEDGSPAHTIKKFGLVNRYDLTESFPILTLRKTNFKSAVDEMLWIWQKKSNNVNDLNSHIWDSWADDTGSIGKAYGYQLKLKHKYKEGEFDQVDRVIYDLKNNPASRRIMTNIYNFQDLIDMHLYPCAYSMTFNVSGNRLNAILNQRSQDMLAANNWNVVQYSILVHMMAQISGLVAGELVHVISDAHIYDRHVPIIRDLITKESHESPTLEIDTSIKDFYKFNVDSFKLLDYKYNPFKIKVPIAV
jgi:thymidylate synthase